MTKPLFYLAGGLLMALSVAFVVHSTLIPDQLLGQIRLMWLCYGLNYVLAALIFFGALVAHKKNAMLVGFVFMGGSVLKFAVFFLLIYPNFKDDGIVGRDELSLFFVPYLISLFSMTYASSRVLQRK
jgi:amino acid permease